MTPPQHHWEQKTRGGKAFEEREAEKKGGIVRERGNLGKKASKTDGSGCGLSKKSAAERKGTA